MSDIPEEHVTYWQQRAEEEYPELAGLRRELDEAKRREVELNSAYHDKVNEQAIEIVTLRRRVEALENSLGAYADECNWEINNYGYQCVFIDPKHFPWHGYALAKQTLAAKEKR